MKMRSNSRLTQHNHFFIIRHNLLGANSCICRNSALRDWPSRLQQKGPTASVTQSRRNRQRTRCLTTHSTAVSVEWFVRYADYNSIQQKSLQQKIAGQLLSGDRTLYKLWEHRQIWYRSIWLCVCRLALSYECRFEGHWKHTSWQRSITQRGNERCQQLDCVLHMTRITVTLLVRKSTTSSTTPSVVKYGRSRAAQQCTNAAVRIGCIEARM